MLGVVYSFKRISTSSGVFSAEIRFIWECLEWFIRLKAYQLLMGYLMPELD